MLFDLHVHTNLSPCSRMTPEALVAEAKMRGVDGVCITDHDSMKIRHRLEEGIQPNGLCVIFGMEYTTTQGDFLIFGPFEELPPLLPAERLLAIVAKNGGAAIGAHPFRRERPLDGRLVEKGMCTAIETVNGRNTDQENRAVEQWRAIPELTCCGGSDAHTLEELGRVATRFSVSVDNRAELIAAINSGHCRPELPDLPIHCSHPQTADPACLSMG